MEDKTFTLADLNELEGKSKQKLSTPADNSSRTHL